MTTRRGSSTGRTAGHGNSAPAIVTVVLASVMLMGQLGRAAVPAAQGRLEPAGVVDARTGTAVTRGATVEPAPQAAATSNQSLAPYVPTPQDVVERMLALAAVTRDDVVYDLGCGDGRMVITAAKKYGAHGVGIDIDPERIAESQAGAKAAGVESLVSFKLQDAMTVDVSPATVVTLYLLSSSNLKLRPILTKELRPGGRIVSHAFSMGDWRPDKVETFTDANGSTRTIYLWKADGKIRE